MARRGKRIMDLQPMVDIGDEAARAGMEEVRRIVGRKRKSRPPDLDTFGQHVFINNCVAHYTARKGEGWGKQEAAKRKVAADLGCSVRAVEKALEVCRDPQRYG